jgi:hypothetical protein
VEVRDPQAVLLADLYEIASDLAAASGWGKKAIELGSLAQRDISLEEALVTASVIKYGRCFVQGVRLYLGPSDIASLDDHLRQTHVYFIALRHRFVAHAVNAFENTFVTVNAREKDGVQFQATAVHPGSNRVLLSAEAARSFVPLIDSVAALVASRVKAEEERVLSYVQSLPTETVHSWDLHSPALARAEDVDVARKRGVNARSKSLIDDDGP